MLVLRSQEAVHGSRVSSNVSTGTTKGDDRVKEALRSVRGEHYLSTYWDFIDLLEEVRTEEMFDIRPFIRARRLLDALPNGVPAPEVGIDPDGEVALDWIRSNRTLVSVSVGVTDNLSFAARFDDGTSHGVIRHTEAFPRPVVDMLRRLYRSG